MGRSSWPAHPHPVSDNLSFLSVRAVFPCPQIYAVSPSLHPLGEGHSLAPWLGALDQVHHFAFRRRAVDGGEVSTAPTANRHEIRWPWRASELAPLVALGPSGKIPDREGRQP